MKKKLFGVYIILMIIFTMACSNDILRDKDKNFFHVAFDTNCEIELDGQEIEEGKTAKEPSSITKVGYIFDGWYYKDTKFDFATPITSNLTLSAKWNPIIYTIKFDKNGGFGNDMENASCFYDEEKKLPLNTYIAPIGMQFIGWSTQKNSLSSNYLDGETIKNLTTENNATIKLYAIWSEKDEHSIIYENILFDDELINNSENPMSFYESRNIELKKIERTGYIFEGWFTDSECSDSNKITGWSAGDKTEDLILFAKWTPIIYKIIYEGVENATNPNTITSYTINDAIVLQPAEKDDYNCIGWNYGIDIIQNIPRGTIGDIILTAQWKPKNYEITYILNNGENYKGNLTTYTIETNVVLGNPKRNGYDFEGWFEDSNFSTSEITGWKAGERHSDITLYAKWKIIPYKVSFQTEYGTIPEAIMVIPNAVITESQLPVLYSEEKRFSGWFDGDIKVIAESYIVTKDVTLIAKWTDIKYTVSYNSNGGSFVSDATVIRNNKALKPDNPYKPATISKRYIFEGWFTSEDGGITLSDTPFDFNNTKITTDIILYAKWSEISITYIVTFNSNGGSKVLEQSVTGGGKIVKPNNPSKNATLSTEYTFLNWYTSLDNGNILSNQPFDFDTIITDNLTLYAKWTENPITYSVTFYPNNGNETITQTIRGGDKAELPSNVSKSDTETVRYRLEGWYESTDNGLTLSAHPFEFDNTIIISDTVLYASWQEIPIYTVTFNSNGGSDVATQIVETGNVASKPIKPKKEKTATHCYVFAGWYTSEDDGATLSSNEFDFENTAINENISLYAKWNEVALYQFHSTITSYGSVSHYSKEYVLVYFGDWPQTVKAENVTVDESESIIMGAHTYYLGDDGNYYAKCIENAYGNNYKYSDGSIVSNITANKTKYFKVEPIKWRVLQKINNVIPTVSDPDHKAITLFAENILTANIPFYLGNDNRWINNTNIYPNNYDYSTIQAYLNGVYQEGDSQEQIYKDKGFLQTAFTQNNDPSRLRYSSLYLLDVDKITNENYGFQKNSSTECGPRKKKTTDYALANYTQLYWDRNNNDVYGYYWLSTPYKTPQYAQIVQADGWTSIGKVDEYKYIGVVPAMGVTLSLQEFARAFY